MDEGDDSMQANLPNIAEQQRKKKHNVSVSEAGFV
jgi:hypothetical protein